MSLKKAEQARQAGEKVGDCIDCNQCVAVCPTGVDIRNGVAARLHPVRAVHRRLRHRDDAGRPADAADRLRHRHEHRAPAAGKPPVYRVVRPRTILYAAIIAVVGGIMLYALATRSSLGISVLHDRNPLFVTLADGSVRNGYTVRLLNKGRRSRSIALEMTRSSRRGDTHLGDRTRRRRQADRRGRAGPDPRSPGVGARCRQQNCRRKQPTSSSGSPTPPPASRPRCATISCRVAGNAYRAGTIGGADGRSSANATCTMPAVSPSETPICHASV